MYCTLAPRNFPPSPPENAAYWPETQRTPLAKEGTNGIWPAISQFFEESCVLLHAPKLGHYFTSPPKEGMLWIFSPEKSDGFGPRSNPRSWVPEASMLTTRLPKSLFFDGARLSLMLRCVPASTDLLPKELAALQLACHVAPSTVR
jgi:hypothetical protein